MPSATNREWIPPMLRPLALLAVVVLCLGMIAALEVLHHFTATRILSPENGTVLNLARYMPTLGAILIGYFFKEMASDLKKVTPWANMSGKWAVGSDSILLDYFNSLEIVAVFAALKRKHWAISTGLTGAFICGALVPFANSLVYVDLSAPRNTTTTIAQLSTFDFDDQPLAMTNGSLKIPWNSTGTQPYARATLDQLETGPRAIWTTGNYAFDEFALPDQPNVTVSAEVNAISATMDCHRIRYSPMVSEYTGKYFTADANDLKAAGCTLSQPLISFVAYELKFETYESPFASLNITQCSDTEGDDVRILVNHSVISDNSSLSGFICSPQFASHNVSLSVNSTTSEITAFSPTSESTPLDVKTSIEALWVYLQNPVSTETQEFFGSTSPQGSGLFTRTAKPAAKFLNITTVVGDISFSQDPRHDPFMQVVMGDEVESAQDDLDAFITRAESFAGKIWAQLISSLARTKASNDISVTITATDQRILLRIPVLRTLEALLAVVVILAITFALGLRPKTLLVQDPGSLAAAAIILSVSDASTEREMASQAIASAQSMNANLASARFTLRKDYGVTMDRVHDPDQVETEGIKHRKLGRKTFKSAPDNHNPGAGVRTDDVSQGWRPAPLHFASKVALAVAFLIVIIGLGIMLWFSKKLDGICVDTQVSSTALSLTTSTILVLLGYCCAGVDGAAQSLAPFNTLRKKPNTNSIFTDDLSFFGRFSGLGSRRINATLLASAAYILIIPAMKLVAAGLFSPVDTLKVEHVDIQVDDSLNANFESTLNYTNPAPVIKRACEYAEWESTPDFDLRPRAGIIDNLVLTEMIAVAGEKNNTADSVIEARVPALAVDIQCEAIPSTNFNLSIWHYSDKGNMLFEWYCATERCYKALGADPFTIVQTLQTSIYADSEIPSYMGEVGRNRNNASDTGLPSDWNVEDAPGPDLGYWVFIADYTSLGGSIASYKNITAINDDKHRAVNTTIWATPNTLNVSLPSIRATVCSRNLSMVSVNASFIRPTQATIGTGTQLLPWRPASVDTKSIVYERAYPEVQPYYFQPPRFEKSQYTTSEQRDGKLSGDSLWPTGGSSENFFELLASDAQYRAGNLSRLLDPFGLADSARQMYTAYCTQMFTELRPYATDISPDSSSTPQTLTATITYHQPRMHQDPTTTYVLIALLICLALMALLVFYHFPSKPILPNPPGSIAARFSLLGGSKLVRGLRGMHGVDLKRMQKAQSETAALGWWHTTWDISSTSTLTVTEAQHRPRTWRWGVDTGGSDDVILQSWNEPPFPSGSSSSGSHPRSHSRSLSPAPWDSVSSAPIISETGFVREAHEYEVPLGHGGDLRTGSISSLSSITVFEGQDYDNGRGGRSRSRSEDNTETPH